MVDVVHAPIDDKQAEMHIWPHADFLWFRLRARGIHTAEFFAACPLNANVAR